MLLLVAPALIALQAGRACRELVVSRQQPLRQARNTWVCWVCRAIRVVARCDILALTSRREDD